MAEIVVKREEPVTPPVIGVTLELNKWEASVLVAILREYVELGGGYDVTAPEWADKLEAHGVNANDFF